MTKCYRCESAFLGGVYFLTLTPFGHTDPSKKTHIFDRPTDSLNDLYLASECDTHSILLNSMLFCEGNDFISSISVPWSTRNTNKSLVGSAFRSSFEVPRWLFPVDHLLAPLFLLMQLPLSVTGKLETVQGIL